MLSDSVGGLLGVAQGSIMSFGGSIGKVLANGLGTLTGSSGNLFDGLATGSRVVEEEGK